MREESRRTFLTAVAMERRIMAFILFFFLVIAGFSISAILIMIVLEKIRDIGILLAMGSSQSGIAQIFLTYGVTIGLVGALIGLALGVAFAGARGKLYERIRSDGVVVTSGDRVPDLTGISAPVFGVDGAVVGALTLTLPSNRMRPEFSAAVRAAARRLTLQLGGPSSA